MRTPFLGQAYQARSINLAYNRLVNMYSEAAAEGNEVAAFYGTPGLELRATCASAASIRGMLRVGAYLYVANGTKISRFHTSSWTEAVLGTMNTSTGPVSMSANSTQLLAVDGGDGYIVTLSSGAFATISDPDFPASPNRVAFLDSYFIVNDSGTQKFYISTLADGSSWDALDFASEEGSPDNIVSLISDHRELWLLGEVTTGVWANSGNPDFPFERIQGAFIEQGCAAVHSVAKLDNTVFWLGASEIGQGVVWKATGYTGARISTHAIETAIQGYSDISDAIGMAYQSEGHTFYILTFPTGNATWVYDAATNLWHERAYLNPSDDLFDRHRANCLAFFDGETIVGDHTNGKLYAFDLDVYEDNGDPIKSLRSWPALPPGTNTLKRTFQWNLEIICETGVGLVDDDAPTMQLRWSDDAGHNWSNEHSRDISAGAIGETGLRVNFTRLGASQQIRYRLFELSMTDPVKRTWLGAELTATAGRS